MRNALKVGMVLAVALLTLVAISAATVSAPAARVSKGAAPAASSTIQVTALTIDATQAFLEQQGQGYPDAPPGVYGSTLAQASQAAGSSPHFSECG